MRGLSLLLLGLLACAPKPATVNVPVSVDIPAVHPTVPAEETPLYAPQWTLTNKNPELVKVESAAPLEAKYTLLGSKDFTVIVQSIKGRLVLICDNGLNSIFECSNGGTATYMCNGIWLDLTCKFKKIINGIVEEDPLIEEPKQTEGE